MAAEAARSPADRAWSWARTPVAARRAWWLVLVAGAGVIAVAGRRQWFVRDDWALLLTRARIRHDFGIADWLFTPQDGHWLTVPALLYRIVQVVFGLGSYWPFLLLAVVPHILTVVLVGVLCRRHGVSAWTTTLVTAVLLVFGSGWENIVFAVQVSYNLTLLGFLAQVVLTDHDGPPDRRDALGLLCGAVGMMSSGFGPFFIGGIALFLILRRRPLAALIAAAPLAAGYGLWWLTYGADQVAERTPGGASQVPAFAVRGLTATFGGLAGIPALAGLALIGTLAVVATRRAGRLRPALIALAVTAVVMYAGIGVERVGLGLHTAEASRYLYMAAMLLAPAFALAVDELLRIGPSALVAGRVVLVASVVLNIGILLGSASAWAAQSTCERHALELLAGAPAALDAADSSLRPLAFSPDVRLADLTGLVADHAVVARPSASPTDAAIVAAALNPATPACPRP